MKKSTVVIIRNAYVYDFGGGERFPVFLAQELMHHRYDPLVVSRSKKLLNFAKAQGVSVKKGWWWSHQNWSGWRMILSPVYIIWQLLLSCWYLKLFYTQKPSVVHVQSKDDFIAASLAGRIVGVRVIWTDHADLKHIWKNVDKPFRNLTGKVVLWAARFAYKITLVSKSEEDLVSNNISNWSDIRHKLTVVHNGVADRYADYTHLYKDEVYTFCVASRLVVDKGIVEVIEAFQQLQSQYPDTKLEIMGDGPDREILMKKAEGINNISFLGHIEDPLKKMASSSVFVHPTHHEGFSVALVEASMMRLPIIATNVGGNPEIIKDNKTGLLVSAKSSDQLTQAMEKLYLDRKLAVRLGSNAREEYLKYFEFSAIVKNKFIPLYTDK